MSSQVPNSSINIRANFTPHHYNFLNRFIW